MNFVGWSQPKMLKVLGKAQDALADLMMGKHVVEVVADGYVAKYQQANKADLEQFIDNLAEQIYGKRPAGAIPVLF